MKQSYLNKLEYNKILRILSNYCKTYIGKNIAINLHPSNNTEDVKNMLLETEQAVNLTYRISSLPISEIENIESYLITLESYGTLSIKAL